MAKKRKRGIREPNGRLSRKRAEIEARGAVAEAEAMSVALAARVRHAGDLIQERAALFPNETPIDPRNPRLGSIMGKLRLAGKISESQYKAAERWLEIQMKLEAVTGASALRPRSASDYEPRGGGVADEDDPERVAAYRLIRAAHHSARNAVLLSGPQGHMAVQTFITENTNAPSMLPDLIRALDALKKLFDEG